MSPRRPDPSPRDGRADTLAGAARLELRGRGRPARRPARLAWPVVVPLLVLLVGVSPAWAQRMERFPEQFGPFSLGAEPGQRVTVTSIYVRLVDAREYWRATTLEHWSIQNETHAILARGHGSTRTQPPGEFVEAKGVSAYLLEGRGRPMLLLVFGVVPSPPTSGVAYRVYGFDRNGVFREALTLEPYGDGVMNPIDSTNGRIALAEERYLDVSEWLGSFAIRIRYEYDEAAHRFTPRNRCGPPLRPLLDRALIRAATERGGDPRVELHESPRAGASRQTIRLGEKSQVKLIEACTARFGPTRIPDLWLKVDIDGAVGWLVESEFPKIGLGTGG